MNEEGKKIEGYFRVNNRVIDEIEFDDGIEGFLFLVIARFCNNGQTAFPTHEYLRKKCGCGKSKLIQSIKSLEEKKLLIVTRSSNKTNRYRVNSDCLPSKPYSPPGKPYGAGDRHDKEQYINNNLQNSYKPPYHYEFEEKEMIYHEPNF